jgi:alanyl-tRNA synthetase
MDLMMTSAEIRQRFLDYFAERGHAVVSSSPLVPDDPTLLFTNAGMVQFKDTFLGLQARGYTRAVTVQKCMRVSGKHNDLENVGPSPRHHTFFEMLGNFSFGDYFKRDAIRYAWEFMTGAMGIPEGRLVATVFESDDEAHRIWAEEIELAPERILRMGEKTNFWMMADVGPCGPTSEIHYDFGPEHCTCGRADCSVALDNDCGRWLEVWNNVFMQFDQHVDGSRAPLPKTGVDTGMGLERLVAVQQHVYANYDTDLFAPLLDRIQRLLAHTDGQRAEHQVGYRVLADHGRAMTFLIADGVVPGNEGRNYVLRLIMRRAMRFGRQMGFAGPFLPDVADAVIELMQAPYPELAARADWVRAVVTEEEARFARTIESGSAILDDVMAQVRSQGGRSVPGAEVFRLYDTFGFPPDLTRVIAAEAGLGIDQAGFEAAMAGQRERARAGGSFGVGAAEDAYRRLGLPETVFVGYDRLTAEATVLALVVAGQPVDRAGVGAEVEIVVDITPFYAEGGGQVGDTGTLVGPRGGVRVLDTRSPIAGLRVHYGVVERGDLAVGDTVTATVDGDRRLDVMRNHTATHLLHRALQAVLGGHAQQRGSWVAPERLRFDFAHLTALSRDELTEIATQVNAWVRDNAPVTWEHMPLTSARDAGATMLFGEKYGDEVRVVTVAGISKELCGGTHLQHTGQIGALVITGEASVGAGLRRIEAVTGRGAERYVRQRQNQLDRLAELVGSPTVEALEGRVQDVLARSRDLGREVEQLRAELARLRAASAAQGAVAVEGVPVLATRVSVADVGALRGQVDALRDRVGSGVVVVGAVIDGAPRVVVGVTDDVVVRGVHAGQLVKALATRLGGGGGGRPGLAEAGGKDPGALDAALAAVPDLVRAQLGAASS